MSLRCASCSVLPVRGVCAAKASVWWENVCSWQQWISNSIFWWILTTSRTLFSASSNQNQCNWTRQCYKTSVCALRTIVSTSLIVHALSSLCVWLLQSHVWPLWYQYWSICSEWSKYTLNLVPLPNFTRSFHHVFAAAKQEGTYSAALSFVLLVFLLSFVIMFAQLLACCWKHKYVKQLGREIP